MSDVTFVQDGLAHRPYRAHGERISLACRPEGSQPIDLFDVVLLQTVGPLRRCQDCYLDSGMLTTICDRHSTWGAAGDAVSSTSRPANCQRCLEDPPPAPVGKFGVWAADPARNDMWEKILQEAIQQGVPTDTSRLVTHLVYDDTTVGPVKAEDQEVFKLETIQGSIDVSMSKEASRSMRDFLAGERLSWHVQRPGVMRPGETISFSHGITIT